MKAMKGAEASLSLCQFGNDAAAYVGIGAAFGSPLFYVRSGRVGSGRVAPAAAGRPGRDLAPWPSWDQVPGSGKKGPLRRAALVVRRFGSDQVSLRVLLSRSSCQ